MAANEQYITDINVFYCNSATTAAQIDAAIDAGKTLIYNGEVPNIGYWLRAPLSEYYMVSGYHYLTFAGWNNNPRMLLATFNGQSWSGSVAVNGPLFYEFMYKTLPYTAQSSPYFPSCNAVFNYTTQQAGMPHAITYTDGKLIFCDGCLIACADGSTTTAWTMNVSTFYEYFMKSMGAYTGTTNPSESSMYSILRYNITRAKFIRLPLTGESATRLYVRGLEYTILTMSSYIAANYSVDAYVRIYTKNSGSITAGTVQIGIDY